MHLFLCLTHSWFCLSNFVSFIISSCFLPLSTSIVFFFPLPLSPFLPLKALQIVFYTRTACLTLSCFCFLLSSQWFLLLAVFTPCIATGAWWERGAAHDCVSPHHTGPLQRLPAARLHVHLPPPSDTEHCLRGVGCGCLPADGPRG